MRRNQIQAGDMVQLIFACCSISRHHIGWTGIVKEIESFADTRCCDCGHMAHGPHAWVVIDDSDVVPLAWLIKVEPPGLAETQTETEELTA